MIAFLVDADCLFPLDLAFRKFYIFYSSWARVFPRQMKCNANQNYFLPSFSRWILQEL